MEKSLKSGWCSVFKIYFRSLVIVGVFVKLINASTLSEPLLPHFSARTDAEIMQNMSILIKDDALEFYNKTNNKIFWINPTIENSPYKVFLK